MPINRALKKQSTLTYANLLLEAAQAEGRIYEDLADLKLILTTIRENRFFKDTLESDEVPLSNRIALMNDVFGVVSQEVKSVLGVMIERGALSWLPRVLEDYENLAEEKTNTVVVDVTTVVELNDHLREVIKKKLSADFNKDIFLVEKINSEIIGGVVVSAHGRRMDASIATQLAHTRVVLSNVSNGGDN